MASASTAGSSPDEDYDFSESLRWTHKREQRHIVVLTKSRSPHDTTIKWEIQQKEDVSQSLKTEIQANIPRFDLRDLHSVNYGGALDWIPHEEEIADRFMEQLQEFYCTECASLF